MPLLQFKYYNNSAILFGMSNLDTRSYDTPEAGTTIEHSVEEGTLLNYASQLPHQARYNRYTKGFSASPSQCTDGTEVITQLVADDFECIFEESTEEIRDEGMLMKAL